jgi:ribosomal protein L11 methyltransferase
VDAISNVFREQGTGGVAIEQPFRSDDEGEEEPVFTGMSLIKAYIPAGPGSAEREQSIERALWHLQAFDLSPVGPLQRREIDEEDWAEGWKKHFHPLRVGRVVIKPTWRDWNAAPDDLLVVLDPGMAFGTGLHPTTRLMLQAIQRRVQPGLEVLDLGTGSGILAIAAARLGAMVTALDISEVAAEVARDNVVENRLTERISVGTGSIESVRGRQFDVILANIIARVLVELAPDLALALRPEGEVLGSGIIEERADTVRHAFTAAGLTLTDEEREGDWWLIAARRPR